MEAKSEEISMEKRQNLPMMCTAAILWMISQSRFSPSKEIHFRQGKFSTSRVHSRVILWTIGSSLQYFRNLGQLLIVLHDIINGE